MFVGGNSLLRRFYPVLRTVVVGLTLIGGAPEVTATPRGADYFTNLPLVTSAGEEVQFFDDLLKDKIVVINFIYTSCPDICSLSTARLAQVYDWLGERMGREIFFYSISLDPENDTPEDMAAFADAFNVGEGWTFLTGDRENIDVIRRKVGEMSRSLAEHRSDMVIGNTRTGVWRRASAMGSLVVLLQSILELDPDYRSRPLGSSIDGESVVDTEYDLSANPGEAIFLKACASCHTIGEGRKFAPDLAFVLLRRDPAWLTRFIMEPDLVLAEGDPIAMALDADYPAIRMPYLGLGEVDVEDVMAYLAAADAKLAAEEQHLADLLSTQEADAQHDHASHGH
jgi:cytochrome oxidase Cu insertion factor (SCO1/SenC/PrrC family)/mono/diheme cytochrome c family protein